MDAAAITKYELNQKRPWSEFRPVLFPFVVFLHLVAVGAILWHAVGGFWPSATTIVTGAVLYIITGFGIALGYHRLFTHQGYKCGPVLKGFLLLAGGLSLEGPIDVWVRTHKLHHANSDLPGDAHSPYQYGGTKWLTLKGILWAHIGWLFYRYELPARERSDSIDRDKMMQFQSRHYLWIVIGTFALPALIGAASGLISDGWQGMLVQGFDGALVAGVLRVLLLLHVTWSVNSVCHLRGERLTIMVTERKAGQPKIDTYYPSDGSRNAFWLLKALGFGEPNHALHHLFQQVAYHGWRKWDIDPSKWVLMGLEKIGVVWDVKTPPEFEVLPLEVKLPEESLVTAAEDLKVQRKLSLVA
jgi:stearoyl-CoA desaturase (delta-9 desaturase)